jgi:hypothetical protein
MTTPATSADSPSLEQRLANLEAQNRRLRFAVGAIALGMILYAAWHTFFIGAVRATVVEARQGVVRDPAGRARIVLGTDDRLPDTFRAKDNPGLLLSDEKGALRAQLYASEELTGLGLFDPDGKPRVAVTHCNDWSGCFLKDHGGPSASAWRWTPPTGRGSSSRTRPSGPSCPCREYKVASKASAGSIRRGMMATGRIFR